MTSKTPQIAILDTNILYSAGMRDILLQLAALDLFQAKWSSDIHRELMKTFGSKRLDLDPATIQRMWLEMNFYFPNALITDYEHLIDDADLPDPDDRHVLAAARHGHCDTIITQNLRDFPVEILKPFGIEVYHPDDFLLVFLETYPDGFLSAIRAIRARLKNPPYTLDAYLANLSQLNLDKTVTELRQYSHLLA